jgi:colanic acid/amylovoran biosynthesis glycosyltransferase
MENNQAKLPRCAHYASKYLPLTENWIYRILINQKAFIPIFLTRHRENLSLFPLREVYSLDFFSKVRQYFEIVLFHFFGYFLFQKRICKKRSVQIIHAHFGYHGIKLIDLAKTLQVPLVCSFYGDDAFAHANLSMAKRKYQRLFRESNRILALGPYMKARLIQLGCVEDKIIVHHLGIDVNKVSYRKRQVGENDRIRFLIASSFVKKKGIVLAINALSHFKEKYSFSLDIIGDGPLREEIHQAIYQTGMQELINLHGYKPYDYVINLAYQSDVFIQASLTTEDNRKEGTPMAIVDAMATGMAIISTTHSDIPEIVIDEQHGYLAEEGSVESLIVCFQKIFSDPTRLEIFSVNSRERVEREFNAVVQTKKMEDLYFQLIRETSLRIHLIK